MRPILLHNHIFKNAGTTIDWSLRRSFENGFIDHRDDTAIMKGGMPYVDRLVRSAESLRAISSHHMPFSPAYAASDLCYWHLFMLRDPLDRALSVYDYERRQPASQSDGARMAKSLSTREFFRWYLRDFSSPPTLRSHYVRQLTDDWQPDKVMDEHDLDVAIRNSAAAHVLIGLVERFDECMVLFELALRADFPEIDLSYMMQNQRRRQGINAHQQLLETLGPDLFDELQANLTLDARLYKFVEERVNEQIAAIIDFESHLRDFRERCTTLRLTVTNDIYLMQTIMNL